jgi:polyhydroxyalkanoate synthase
MQKPNPPAEINWSAYQVKNPEELVRNVLKLVEEGSQVIAGLMNRADMKSSPFSAASELSEASKVMTEVTRQWMTEPSRALEMQGELVRGYMDVWTNAVQHALGQTVESVAEPEAGDGRFRDPEWSTNPYFNFWKQSYLVTTTWAEKALAETEGLDERTRQRAAYYLRQISSALSPSNFPVTNPEVVRETLQSNGANLVKGLEQLSSDIQNSGDLMKISQTDVSAFEVGRNLAVTPGKVVFQNDILQLIQYTPTTEKVHAVPLLIVPPWINKFYILDLTPPKSFIKWVVDQGFTVFVVSWVNPDERLSHKSFEAYMKEGILAAADAVKRETGQKQSNVLGYCVGGTLLASTLAWNAAKKQDPFVSATFLAAQVDFKNYMLGKKPFPFDLLFWNQDSTRMPAANHNFYLREFYHENKLAKGELTIGGTKLDMKKVKLPVYELATREDHIAPAESVYIGSQLFGGPVEYVLAGSGHIAGVVNPPAPEGKKPKYQFWSNPDRVDTLAEWLEGAKETPGSWWPHWAKWLASHSGGKVPAREPGSKLGVIEDAPGSYVRAKA